MELNEEAVKKSLDWLDSLVGNSNDSDIALLTYQLLGILYDTCEELTEENERLRAEVSVKKKLLDEAENRYNETAKHFYKEGVKDMKSEIKKTLSALCKGDVSEIHRMIDEIAKEIENEN